MIKKLLYGISLMLLLPGVAQAMETKAAVAAKADTGVIFIDDKATNIRAVDPKASEVQVCDPKATKKTVREIELVRLQNMSLIDGILEISDRYPALAKEIEIARAANLENRVIVIMLDAIWHIVHKGSLSMWRKDDDDARGSLQGDYKRKIDMLLEKRGLKEFCMIGAHQVCVLNKLQGKQQSLDELYKMMQPYIALHQALYAEYEKRYLGGVSEKALLLDRFPYSLASLPEPVFDDTSSVRMARSKEIVRLLGAKWAVEKNNVTVESSFSYMSIYLPVLVNEYQGADGREQFGLRGYL